MIKMNQWSIGAKLFGGFLAVLGLMLLVAGVGAIGTSTMSGQVEDITTQLEITKKVNHVLADAQDAQANALRYIIYNDGKYQEAIRGNYASVLEQLDGASELMTNEESLDNARAAGEAMDAYAEQIERYAECESLKAAQGKQRAEAAAIVRGQVCELLDKIQRDAREKTRDESGVEVLPAIEMERVTRAQECLNALNMVYIKAYLYLLAKTPEKRSTISAEWIQEVRNTSAALAKTREVLTSEEDIAAIDKSIEATTRYKEQVHAFLAVHQEQLALMTSQRRSAGEVMRKACDVRDTVYQHVEKVKADADLAARRAGLWILVVSVTAGVIGLGAAYMLTIRIARPLKFCCDGVRNLAGLTGRIATTIGDDLALGNWNTGLRLDIDEEFRHEVARLSRTRGDEIGDMCRASGEILGAVERAGESLNFCIDQVNDALLQVDSTVLTVVGAASQVSSASQSLSQGATEQATSLEEITSSVQEMSEQTNQNAENARLAEVRGADAATAADGGQAEMERLLAAMSRISANAEETKNVVRTIDDIAFQTNLLALNAAVEAARAGNQGKGFAVVAQEVRNLAARSAKAAKETAELIENSNTEVREGVEIAKKTNESLAAIGDHVGKTSALIKDIASASDEQAQGVAQANQGLSQIDSVTQQNSANAEETATAAEEMTQQANMLRELVGRFQLRHEGPSASRTASDAGAERHVLKEARALGHSAATATRDASRAIALDDHEFGKF